MTLVVVKNELYCYYQNQNMLLPKYTLVLPLYHVTTTLNFATTNIVDSTTNYGTTMQQPFNLYASTVGTRCA